MFGEKWQKIKGSPSGKNGRKAKVQDRRKLAKIKGLQVKEK